MCYRLVSAASSTFGAFIIGAVGSIAGTVVAWLLLGPRLGPDGWKVSSCPATPPPPPPSPNRLPVSYPTQTPSLIQTPEAVG